MIHESQQVRFPWLMTIITTVVAVTLMIARQVEMSMADTVFQHDFAILNIATMVVIPLLIGFWLLWLRLCSGWPRLYARTIPLALVGAFLIFLVLFRPRIDGSLAVKRWEPRFWSNRAEKMIAEDATIELGFRSEHDFPQFLGPDRNSRIDKSTIEIKDLKDQLKWVWKKTIGQGCSGFVASGGYAFTMAQDGGDELVVCFEIETGDTKWIHRHSARHDDPLSGVGPRSTPTIHEGKIYALGAKGLLVCLDATNGELQWKVELPKLLGIEVVESYRPKGTIQSEQTNAIFGRSSSPLVYDGKVIVAGGGPKEGPSVSLVAFDKDTGNEVWRGGEQPLGYASPSVWSIRGADQILITNESSVSGHDPQTGRELWNHPWPGNSDRDANTSQPVDAGDNRILITKGYGGGAELFEVFKNEANEYSTKSIWRNRQVLKTKMTSAVVDGQHAYGLSDRILECVDLVNGKRIWKNGRYGHGQLLLIGNQLLIHGEKGFLALVPAKSNKYEELSRVDTIDGICWNTICFYDPYILVRSDLEAACLKLAHHSTSSK